MPDESDETKGKLLATGAFLWANKDWIWEKLKEIRTWFRSGKGTKQSPGILILGPGGVGKSTLARLLSEDYNPLVDLPGDYVESVRVESYKLQDRPEIEVVVPPGQKQRREATWADLHSDLASGKFRGVIFLSAFGFHSFMIGYRGHRLYAGDKKQFVKSFCAERRAEELSVLQELKPHLTASRSKLWMLSLVTKQDLWWGDKAAESFYKEGDYGREIQSLLIQRGGNRFLHDFVFASLVIRNFVDSDGKPLESNKAGYDQKLQIESLRRLFEKIDSFRKWEMTT